MYDYLQNCWFIKFISNSDSAINQPQAEYEKVPAGVQRVKENVVVVVYEVAVAVTVDVYLC